jgi:hypothetical protein
LAWGSKTTRDGDDVFERDEAAGHPFAPIALSRFQSVLHRACASSLAKRVSEVGELQSVWRTDAPDAGTVEFVHVALFGLSFIASTAVAVCHNKRIPSHRVFAGLAERGKTPLGWFYGFKWHWVVNDCGEVRAFCFTTGHVDDRRPVPRLARKLFTKLCKNMKNMRMAYTDRLLLPRRAIVESTNDQLKNISQIEHSPQRSPLNFLVNLVAGPIPYCLQPQKPSLGIIRHAHLSFT